MNLSLLEAFSPAELIERKGDLEKAKAKQDYEQVLSILEVLKRK